MLHVMCFSTFFNFFIIVEPDTRVFIRGKGRQEETLPFFSEVRGTLVGVLAGLLPRNFNL